MYHETFPDHTFKNPIGPLIPTIGVSQTRISAGGLEIIFSAVNRTKKIIVLWWWSCLMAEPIVRYLCYARSPFVLSPPPPPIVLPPPSPFSPFIILIRSSPTNYCGSKKQAERCCRIREKGSWGIRDGSWCLHLSAAGCINTFTADFYHRH